MRAINTIAFLLLCLLASSIVHAIPVNLSQTATLLKNGCTPTGNEQYSCEFIFSAVVTPDKQPEKQSTTTLDEEQLFDNVKQVEQTIETTKPALEITKNIDREATPSFENKQRTKIAPSFDFRWELGTYELLNVTHTGPDGKPFLLEEQIFTPTGKDLRYGVNYFRGRTENFTVDWIDWHFKLQNVSFNVDLQPYELNFDSHDLNWAVWNRSLFNTSNSLASSNQGASNYATMFDGSAATWWQPGTTAQPAWFMIRLTNQSAFQLNTINMTYYDNTYKPGSVQIYGSNDALPNGTSGNWTLLATNTSIQGTNTSFNFSNTNSYKFYLVNMSTNNNPANPAVTEMLLEYTPATTTSTRGMYGIINGSTTGPNNQTYLASYDLMVQNTLAAPFNNTITFNNGSATLLTTPEFISSSYCHINNLSTTYAPGANFTYYEFRSDHFSEVGLVLSLSNQSQAFDDWYNTLLSMNGCSAGSLPCWAVRRNDTKIEFPVNDTATDGSIRAGLALYYASNNSMFSDGNRTKYRTLANQIAADSYRYETATIPAKNTRSGVSITRLPFTGRNCASSGLIGCTPDFYEGYFSDTIKFFQYAFAQTGNLTYFSAAQNFTYAALSLNLQNDTDADGWGVAPYNFDYDNTSTYLGHTCGAGCDTWKYQNQPWDDSDAPRYKICDLLRIANKSGGIVGAYLNLSTYCTQFSKTNTFTNTTSCLQYNYNGSCNVGLASGFYQNGLGTYDHTWYNASFAKPKLDEALSHYSWSTKTFDSESCQNPLSFRGTKTLKPLASLMGLDEDSLTYQNTTGNSTSNPFNATPRISPSTIYRNQTLYGYCNGTANTSSLTYNYAWYRNNTLFYNDTARNYCYQETANSSTSCGGLSTGRYALSPPFIYMNYTIPSLSVSAKWQVRFAKRNTENITVPTQCFSNNVTLQLRFYAAFTDAPTFRAVSYGECYNTTSWQLVTSVVNETINTGSYTVNNYQNYLYDGDYSTGTAYSYTLNNYAGSYCDQNLSYYDQCNAYLFDEAIYWAYFISNNTEANTSTITTLNKNDIWTLSCQANDTNGVTTDWYNTSITVSNTAPNASTVLPVNITGGLNCTYTFSDEDGDSESSSTYKWFVNGTASAITTRTIGSSNYSIGASIRCEVTPNDGTTPGTPRNSSNYIPSDTTPPTINSATIPTTGLTSDILTVQLNCTDANSLANGYPKVNWNNPNSVTEGNFTMTLNVTNGLYEKTYTFNTIGSYTNFTFYCTDGSNNQANYTAPTTLTITTGSTPPTGGGGSATTTPNSASCAFRITKPTAILNTGCTAGSKSTPTTVTIFNDQGTTQQYNASVTNVVCSISETTFQIAPNTEKTITVNNCNCPTNSSIQGTLVIQNNACTKTVPIELYENFLVAIFERDSLFATVLIAIGILAVGGIGILVLLSKR